MRVRRPRCADQGVSSQRYDAIFLDVRMPDLDGVELGAGARRFSDPPQLVFVSAYDSAAVDAFELHALDYLRKPVSRRRVEEALGARRGGRRGRRRRTGERARAGHASQPVPTPR